jgi:hypothetical protein
MGTLKNSIVDPSIVENDLGRLELRKESNRNEKVMDELAEKMALWKKVKSTPAGQTLIELSDMEIKSYEAQLAKPTKQLMGLGDLPSINEARAEWRGCLAVWKSIKYNMVELENKLEEMKKMQEKEVNDKRAAAKKKLENYR